MSELWQQSVIAPWSEDTYGTVALVLMGFFTCAACGTLGVFLLLRRMALMGDAMSHSLLPGLVGAFLLTGERTTPVLFGGALVAGLVCVLGVEYIHRNSRIKADAAMGILFSTLFALGVLLVTTQAHHIDLDADCILYGDVLFILLAEPVPLGPWGGALPVPVLRMGLVLLGVLLLTALFYRPLMVSTFDATLARSLGFHPGVIHYTLMLVLALVIVSAFEAVGAILVIAMLILPGATSLLLARRLSTVLACTLLLSGIFALGGFHLNAAFDTSLAGNVVVVALGVFLVVWLAGLLRQRLA